MIQRVRMLLVERNLTRAVIVDDAYDDTPAPGEIRDELWDRFFDDLSDDDERALAGAYGTDEYDRQDVSELRRDPLFIDAAWRQREQIAAAGALFEEFQRSQAAKREELEPLRTLLQDQLGLMCGTFGREEGAPIADAGIIFIDLYLGLLESEDAVSRAIARVKRVVDQRRDSPPSVVVLSASPHLHEVGPRLRDDAELLGCQFRMIAKTELVDSDKMAECLYDLVVTYPDSQKLNKFLLSWDTALSTAKSKFLRSIRTLDLADYANLQALVLEAEDEPVGDYVLDLYDVHLHTVLEEDEGLIRTAKALNEIDWTKYPPAQFMPSPALVDMMDGALFYSETRTRVEAEIAKDATEVKLGDVFLAPVRPVAAGAEDGGHPVALPPSRYVFVVLSQACDLQHGNAEQILLMRGTVRPYAAKQHETKGKRTPVMGVGEARFSIEWDVLAPETWRIDELPDKIAEGYARVRRFRTPFALQLQHDFTGNLGRVGTLAAVPARFAAGIRVFLKHRDDRMQLLIQKTADAGDGVYLVGRTAEGEPREWLLLSEGVQDEFRRALREVPAQDLPPGGPTPMATLLDDPAFYRRFRSGLEMKRAKAAGVKPFKGTPHDVVQIVASPICTPGEQAPRGSSAIVVEVDLE